MVPGRGLNEPPRGGDTVVIYYNPELGSGLNPSAEIFFNAGFNGPFMCAGEPRLMGKKLRGTACSPLYSIRINLPMHCSLVYFSFTDGDNWDDGPSGKGWIMGVDRHASLRGASFESMQSALTEEIVVNEVCENAIYPDPIVISYRCKMPVFSGECGGRGAPRNPSPRVPPPRPPPPPPPSPQRASAAPWTTTRWWAATTPTAPTTTRWWRPRGARARASCRRRARYRPPSASAEIARAWGGPRLWRPLRAPARDAARPSARCLYFIS